VTVSLKSPACVALTKLSRWINIPGKRSWPSLSGLNGTACFSYTGAFEVGLSSLKWYPYNRHIIEENRFSGKSHSGQKFCRLLAICISLSRHPEINTTVISMGSNLHHITCTGPLLILCTLLLDLSSMFKVSKPVRVKPLCFLIQIPLIMIEYDQF